MPRSNLRWLPALLTCVTLSASAETDAVSGASAYAEGERAEFSPNQLFLPDSDSFRIANELDLTLEQRDRIKLAAFELEPRVRELAEQGKAIAERFRATQPSDEDYAIVTAEVSQAAAAQASAAVLLAAEMRARFDGLLTEAQMTELKARMEARHKTHGEQCPHHAAPEAESDAE